MCLNTFAIQNAHMEPSLSRFAGKVALVTGGANGIGLATVKRLSSEGAKIAVLDCDRSNWNDICGEEWAQGRDLQFYRCDIRSEQEIASAVQEATAYFGGLDVLINNVGGTTTESFETTSSESWLADLELNLTSHFWVIKSALPSLRHDGGGVIVNVSSINALMSFGNPAYSAAKAGLLALTRSLAIELASDKVRVNAVVPGSVRTDAWEFRAAKNPKIIERVRSWYPGNYIGRPADVASAIAFLAAPEACYVNGASLVVDGGVTAGTQKMISDITIA